LRKGPVHPRKHPAALLVCAAVLLAAWPARALDKQGSAHGGGVEGPSEGFDVSGSASLGVSVYNPTYAARPDNTGLTLFRYAGHADVDVIGRRLSIPIDVNMFTDRTAIGFGRKLVPSELDFITGVTTTWRLGPGAIEGGARYEIDTALDHGGYDAPTASAKQKYADVRARYLYSLAAVAPGAVPALRGGDIRGYLTLGWFAINKTYFARPDNTGLALFRYGAHVEITTLDGHVGLGLDAVMFTDKQAENVVRPSELDFTPEIVGRYLRYELHLAYERDLPVDRGGLVQQFIYLLAVVSF
jgi:hypothetical protein